MSNSPKPKTYLIKTYGCQMNFSDSEKIDSVLQKAGLKPVKDIDKADVIIFNTCSVRQSAEDRILGLKKQMFDLKKLRNKKLRITCLPADTADYGLPARPPASLALRAGNTTPARQADTRLPRYTKHFGQASHAGWHSVVGGPITVLTGCMAKRSWDETIKEIAYREKKYLTQLRRKMPWVDIIIQIKDIAKLPILLGLQPCDNATMGPCNNSTIPRQRRVGLSAKGRTASGMWMKQFSNYLDIPPKFRSNVTAYIPISTGCNEFCTYCIVPYARGKQIDRPAKDILSEVKTLVQNGYKDIMLLGQSVNSWRNPPRKLVQTSAFEPDSINTFLDLLKAIDNIQGDFWLTFLSSHPNYFTQKLIDYFAKSANAGTRAKEKGGKLTIGNHIRPYLNLALQSGSNKILKKMNRKYTIEEFVKICKELKKKIPNLNLSTDIIVGFPNETEKDFEQTAKVLKGLEFDMAYINKYSPRRGTAADLFKDNIPWKTKKRREKRLTKILAKTALKNNKKYLNKTVRVLIEKIEKEQSKKFSYGKTFNYKNIKFPLNTQEKVSIGDFISARITNVTSWNLEGAFK